MLSSLLEDLEELIAPLWVLVFERVPTLDYMAKILLLQDRLSGSHVRVYSQSGTSKGGVSQLRPQASFSSSFPFRLCASVRHKQLAC